MKLKIFIQATKTDNSGKAVEKMFSYDVAGPDKDAAAAEARGRFESEQGPDGWEIASMGSLLL